MDGHKENGKFHPHSNKPGIHSGSLNQSTDSAPGSVKSGKTLQVINQFDNLGSNFPDEVVSSWIDTDGNYRVYGYDPNDKYAYYSVDHQSATSELSDELGIPRKHIQKVGSYEEYVEDPQADEEDVHELLRKTGLIRVANNPKNPNSNFQSWNMENVGLEIAVKPTNAQLRTMRRLDQEGYLISFDVGEKGNRESGEGWDELRKAIGIKYNE